jgi:hypothetical protein
MHTPLACRACDGSGRSRCESQSWVERPDHAVGYAGTQGCVVCCAAWGEPGCERCARTCPTCEGAGTMCCAACGAADATQYDARYADRDDAHEWTLCGACAREVSSGAQSESQTQGCASGGLGAPLGLQRGGANG